MALNNITATPTIIATGQSVMAGNHTTDNNSSSAESSIKSAVKSNLNANKKNNVADSSLSPTLNGASIGSNGEQAVLGLDSNHKSVILIVDKNGKTLRQFPPENFVDELQEIGISTQATGVLVNKKA
jgi:uncharacterized FlaG/YvyC family protein